MYFSAQDALDAQARSVTACVGKKIRSWLVVALLNKTVVQLNCIKKIATEIMKIYYKMGESKI